MGQLNIFFFQGPLTEEASRLSAIALAGMETGRFLEQSKQGNIEIPIYFAIRTEIQTIINNAAAN
jgi:hypothetical protein